MNSNFKMSAKTFFGMENILAIELKNLGAQSIEIKNRLVHFVGDKGFMYKANLSLRTALKILKPIHTAKVRNENELYNMAYNFPWQNYLGVEQSLAIDSVVFGDNFTHSLYVSQKIKDAIVDRFRADTGDRPNVDLDNPDIRINVHIDRETCTLSLDSSGNSLHHRGYRTVTNIAPINEVLAAGIILLSGWNCQKDFLDPMCGSGTILIEAAMIACNIPANINRKKFAFEKWKDWDEDLFFKIEAAQIDKICSPPCSIIGFDKVPSAIEKAKINISNAKLEDFITLSRKDFFHSKKYDDRPLHIVTNPPYGERLDGNIADLYGKIGDTLKQEYQDTNAWIISSNIEAIKNVGLRPSRKIKLFNGKLESKLLMYSIYKGTKKLHKLNSNELLLKRQKR